MSIVTLRRCDRCKVEIKSSDTWRDIRLKTAKGGLMCKRDLCSSCTSKLQEFLEGAELEVPP